MWDEWLKVFVALYASLMALVAIVGIFRRGRCRQCGVWIACEACSREMDNAR